MSTFIQQQDFTSHIREHRLDQVTNLEDEHIDNAEARAIGFIKSHISNRYDCEAIFEATGNDRDPVIMGYTIDIALYYLWRLVAPRKVPTYVKEAYDDAKEWLLGVQAGEITPDGLPTTTNEIAGTIKWGSNPKRSNHI
jgi:phage gp36-like protein